jgi:DNA-binding CsgD family transcriptional regulator
MQLASSLLPLWQARGRLLEGRAWFDAVLASRRTDDGDAAPAIWARALADKSMVDAWGIASDRMDDAQQAAEIARQGGDHFVSRFCRCWGIGSADCVQSDLKSAVVLYRELLTESEAAGDLLIRFVCLQNLSFMLAHLGDSSAAHAAALATIEAGSELTDFVHGCGHMVFGVAALAAGDGATADKAHETAWTLIRAHPEASAMFLSWRAESSLAAGDVIAARRWADDAVAVTRGFHRLAALTARARVAIAQGELDQAERDAHQALVIASEVNAQLGVPDTLECVAGLAAAADSRFESARLFGAADAVRRRIGQVRFRAFQPGYEASVAEVRDATDPGEFETAWAEGTSLSTEEAISYAQRGRGERKRPSSGWASLTPTELDVVRLVNEGLANKDIAARLFISPRTVQTHLTHVYTKLVLTSRVQLAQEAARHA